MDGAAHEQGVLNHPSDVATGQLAELAVKIRHFVISCHDEGVVCEFDDE